jgi:hypothetical protein
VKPIRSRSVRAGRSAKAEPVNALKGAREISGREFLDSIRAIMEPLANRVTRMDFLLHIMIAENISSWLRDDRDGFGAGTLCPPDEGPVEGNKIGAVGAAGQVQGIGEIESLRVEIQRHCH